MVTSFSIRYPLATYVRRIAVPRRHAGTDPATRVGPENMAWPIHGQPHRLSPFRIGPPGQPFHLMGFARVCSFPLVLALYEIALDPCIPPLLSMPSIMAGISF